MLVGELAKRTGTSSRALRHYEALGLLHTIRSENGYRHFSEESVQRVKAIRFLLATGLKTPTIAAVIPAMMTQSCQLRNPAVRSAIKREAERIKVQIDALTENYRVLSQALEKGELRRSGSGEQNVGPKEATVKPR